MKTLDFIALEAGLKIDREASVLFGVQVAKKGIAKGHGIELDDVTLDQIVALGNAQPSGVKVRFGHPSAQTPGLGGFIGVRKNFRRDGDYVRADLYMSKAADPAKAKHVLDMAEYHPDQIGNSVAVIYTEEYRKDARGNRLLSEAGDLLPPLMRITELKAVDIVEDPAAGDGMFDEPQIDAGLLARIIAFFGRQDVPVAATADSDVSVKGVSMELTLSELLEKHPAVAAEHAAKLSAEKETELAAATEAGAVAERTRIVSFLSQCKPFHFSKTAAHPKGFVLHAVENGLSEVECLRGLLELSSKAQTLSTLERESADLPVESAEPADKQLSAADVKRAELLAAVEAHNQKGGA